MTEENPYAPPLGNDTKPAVALMWWTEGGGLIARHGAELPRIDLETGESGPDLVPAKRSYYQNGKQLLIAVLIMMGLILNHRLPIAPLWVYSVILLAFMGGYIFFQRRASPDAPSANVVIIEYRGEGTLNGRGRRRKWLIGLAIAAPVVFWGIVVANSDFTLGALGLCVAVEIALALCAVLDGPKAKCRKAPPGHIHLYPLHPQALEKLLVLEEGLRQEATEEALARMAAAPITR